ncbi:M23 family metallopeptidase [Photorhabdus asymbiotica]|uniref:M23 family metallopeptidase n=1 Tax=Photorhabdus asymbiotica TaxID=291112 RepID=UPI003DA79591
MIISPPMLRNKSDTESDPAWVDRMIPVDARRGFPVNAWHTWHGGVHLMHSDSTSQPEKIRAIADGTVHFVRQAQFSKRDRPPYNYNGGTDCGCVVLKHETEIGSGENGKVTFFSLYMHLKSLDEVISVGKTVYRKDSLGTVGQVDGANAIHFQIFCDDSNLEKLVGRTASELDITQDGRTDVVYGDMHFYLPTGTAFYAKAPEKDPALTREKAQYTSVEPLFITMSFDKGQCTMTTRRQTRNGHYETVGEDLVSENYEYDLYKKAVKLYPDSPSAGYEILRFGRIINTEHETLSPAEAPHWREVNYPAGAGWVNLAVSDVKKFSDADFPHWMGWQLIDDDSNNNSQCHSPTLLAELNAATEPRADLSYTICHFAFEWDDATVESRFNWLKSPNDVLDEPMSEEDWNKFIAHAKALSIDATGLPSGRMWHFDPRRFITHFRKCGWLEQSKITDIMSYDIRKNNESELNAIKAASEKYYQAINKIMLKYIINTPIRQAHFLGQGAVESARLRVMQEYSQEQVIEHGKKIGKGIVRDSEKNESELGHWYGEVATEYDSYFSGKKYTKSGNLIAGSYSWSNGNCGDTDAQKFRGRGFKMLTGRANYAAYWVYRGWLAKRDFDNYWWNDEEYKEKNINKMKKRPAVIGDPQKVTENEYNCIDTGGYFIRGIKPNIVKEMDKDKWHKNSSEKEKEDGNTIVKSITKLINGGDNGLKDRNKMTRKAKEVLS